MNRQEDWSEAMVLHRKTGWQYESFILAGGLALLAVLLTACLALVRPLLDDISILGMPAGFFAVSTSSPIVLTAAAIWFLFRQTAIDRKYHRIED